MSSPPPAQLVVGARFNGPPGSANGGYAAGLLAWHLAGDSSAAVTVTLREPPPLAAPLAVRHAEDGQVVASFGGATILTARSAVFGTDPVPPVPFLVAVEAERRYAGLAAHPFPGCFVCGTSRPASDGMVLRPGRVGVRPDAAVATSWVPAASLGGPDGLVDAPFLWAALDCPGGWAGDLAARPMVLGRLTAAVHARPRVGDRCVVVARMLAVDGRKTWSASTAYDEDGRILGHAESTWIALREESG